MKKQLNPVLGGSLEDLHHRHDQEELENQRDLLHNTLLSPVPGRNFEDLHRPTLHKLEELECRRILLHKTLLHPVLHENLKDLRHLLDEPEEPECQRSVRQPAAKKNTI